jgi:hypothetical protein
MKRRVCAYGLVALVFDGLAVIWSAGDFSFQSTTPLATAVSPTESGYLYPLDASHSNLPDCKGTIAISLGVPGTSVNSFVRYYPKKLTIGRSPTSQPLSVSLASIKRERSYLEL